MSGETATILLSATACPASGLSARDATGGSAEAWARWIAATLRGLDGMTGIPPRDGEYLAVGGRLWRRRGLYWAGFLLWVISVWRGLPGSWRRAGAAERRRQGRRYLPALVYRTLFLLSVLNAPAVAMVLLAPSVALALSAPRRSGGRRVVWFGGLAPTALFAVWFAFHVATGGLELTVPAPLPILAVTATLAAFTVWLLDDAAHAPSRPPVSAV